MEPSARPVTPRWRVKTTRGVISHFAPPAIHIAADAHPPRAQRPAALRSNRPLPDGPHRSWRERPPAPRAWCGIAPSVDSHLRPCLPEVAPEPEIPCGKAIRTPPRNAADQPILFQMVTACQTARGCSCSRANAESLALSTATMAPTPRSGSATTQRPPSGFLPPLDGDRRHVECDALAKGCSATLEPSVPHWRGHAMGATPPRLERLRAWAVIACVHAPTTSIVSGPGWA